MHFAMSFGILSQDASNTITGLCQANLSVIAMFVSILLSCSLMNIIFYLYEQCVSDLWETLNFFGLKVFSLSVTSNLYFIYIQRKTSSEVIQLNIQR